MEIHDSQRLVEVFHLQRVRTETAHLEVLIIATDNRRKRAGITVLQPEKTSKALSRVNVLRVFMAQSTFSSSRYSNISPGVHSNSRQMASKVLRRIALALPVFSMERLAWVMPMRSASSLERILRFASITSMFKIIMAQMVRLFSSTASAATLYMKAKKSRKNGVTKLVFTNCNTNPSSKRIGKFVQHNS